ncbi:MAG: ATP synthase F1 subunit epsilon [Bacteroidales bacterium]|nr:ATP synthase F1 subunit epsilon [Bacteroidales bacterium]
MKLEILTPEKTVYRGEVQSITLPGTMGSFQILNNHAPIISSLTKGLLSFTADGKIKELEVEDGFVETHDNTVIVCIETREANKQK